MANKLLSRYTKKQILLLSSVFVVRLIVGGVFIYSGFVKAIDPWGVFYKINDYLGALQFDSLLPFATFFSFFVPVAEFTLGVFILFGCYRKAAPILLTLSMLVLLPLTGWLAVTDAVTDCGCFGDAIHISNTASFIKNIILTALLVFLVIYNKRLKNVYGFAVQWLVFFISSSFALIIALIGYVYQPLIDFMPFQIGTPLFGETVSEPQYTFIYEKYGTQKEFSLDSLPDESWTFVSRYTQAKVEGTPQLSIERDGVDITSDAISLEGDMVLYLFPQLDDVDISYTYKINEISALARANGIDVVGLTSASMDAITEWIDLSMADYPIFDIDDSILKQIARGNPAIVYVSNGKILWKRAMQSITDEIESSQSFDIAQMGNINKGDTTLYTLVLIYVGLLLLVLIINRTHKVIKFSLGMRDNPKNND